MRQSAAIVNKVIRHVKTIQQYGSVPMSALTNILTMCQHSDREHFTEDRILRVFVQVYLVTVLNVQIYLS